MFRLALPALTPTLVVLVLAKANLITAAELAELRQDTGIHSGLAVVIADELAAAADLASEGKFLVHLLASDESRVAPLRKEVAAAGLAGRIVVGAMPAEGELPYPDRLVNLLTGDLSVLDATARPSEAEIQHVVAVRGFAHVKADAKQAWKTLAPRSGEDLDDWTHRWYDASGNCLSSDRVAAFPRAVQWQHGPAMEDGTADGKIPRIAEGRFVIVDSSSGDLICRDAGNGTLLWRSPLGLGPRDDPAICNGRIYLYHDAKATDEQRRRSRGGLGPLVAVDLATGRIEMTFLHSLRAGTAQAIEFEQTDQNRTRRETPVPWFVVSEDVIVQAYNDELVVLERKSGKLRWDQALQDATWFSPVVVPLLGEDGLGEIQSEDRTPSSSPLPRGRKVASGAPLAKGRTVILAAEAVWPARRGRHDGSGNVRAVVAFDAQTGKQLWRNDNIHPERPIEEKGRRYFSRAEFKPMSAAGGRVLLHTSSYQFRQGGGVAVLDLATGKQLWRHAFDPKERYTQGSQRAVLRGDEVIVMDGLGALRFDAATGKPLGEPLNNRGGVKRLARANAACTASRATLDWLICNAYLYVGPDGRPQPHFGTRGACGQGVIPANGLIYVPPTPCDCGDYMRGHIALAPKLAGRKIDDADRLHTNPKRQQGDDNTSPKRQRGKEEAVDARDPSLARPASVSDWPTFLGDPQRSSYRTKALPDDLRILWRKRIARTRDDAMNADRRLSERYLGALSAPVVGDGVVLVAAPQSHRVIALDARTGEPRWSFHAGGKVDSPPTIAGGLAVFGCEDGCVYAVDAESGELTWRFRAAPTDAVSLQHGHIAAAFPLPGSTLVIDDHVIAVAGHHTDLGGLHGWVLDLATGKPKARRVIGNDQPRVVTNGVAVADEDGKGFWIGKQLHLSLTLEDLPAHWYEGPKPPIAFDRNGTRMRFRTNEGRGGSTHGWKGAMAIPGRNRLLRAHRLAFGKEFAYGMLDPTPRQKNSPMLWATKINDDGGHALWGATSEALGGHESYGAILVAGARVYLGGGTRDGKQGVLQVVDADSGKLLRTHELPACATECGIAASASNRLYVSWENGDVVCFGAK